MEEVIPWTLANDHQKFARYLVPFLDDLLGLSVTMPKVYRVFNKDGQFSVQMSKDNPFGRNEADKTTKHH